MYSPKRANDLNISSMMNEHTVHDIADINNIFT